MGYSTCPQQTSWNGSLCCSWLRSPHSLFVSVHLRRSMFSSTSKSDRTTVSCLLLYRLRYFLPIGQSASSRTSFVAPSSIVGILAGRWKLELQNNVRRRPVGKLKGGSRSNGKELHSPNRFTASEVKQAHGWRRQIRSSVVCLSASLPVVVWIGTAWERAEDDVGRESPPMRFSGRIRRPPEWPGRCCSR